MRPIAAINRALVSLLAMPSGSHSTISSATSNSLPGTFVPDWITAMIGLSIMMLRPSSTANLMSVGPSGTSEMTNPEFAIMGTSSRTARSA